jgi:diguanylate cyclase (GGDEF)-like protein
MLNLLLKDIAVKDNISVQRTATVKDIIGLMNFNEKGVVVVLDGKKPVGILTERDIIQVMFKGSGMDDMVEVYIKKDLITSNGDRTLDYALDLTLENNIRRVIVTDTSNNFLGIVTQQDLLKYFEEDFYRLTIKVKHIVKKTGYLISVSPDSTLKSALKIIAENKISAVSVIKGKKAVGVITEKDILKLATNKVILEDKVKDYMSSPVVTVSLDTALVDVVEIMNTKNIRRVVVANNEGLAINIITLRDVIRNLEKDVSKFFERKLKSAKDILNLLPEMLIEVTDTGKEQLIIWANEKVLNKFGGDIIDMPVTELISQENWDKIYSTLTKFHRIEEIRFKKNSGVYELSGFMVHTDGREEKARLQLIMRDITEDVQLSTVDPLTSLYNRRFVNEFLMKEIGRSKRSNHQFSIVMCDLDNFKDINDTYGHLSGDIVLSKLSQLITETVREQDIVGRYGGDEFVIIFPEASKKITSQIVDRLRLKVENLEIQLPNDVSVKVTSSFGVSTFPEDGISSEDLLINADERLYKAKSMGKNKVAYE